MSYFGCEGIVEEHMTSVLSILLENVEVTSSDASIDPQGREAITGAISRAVGEYCLFLAHTRSMFCNDSAKLRRGSHPRVIFILLGAFL
jgi:hypothetical protein